MIVVTLPNGKSYRYSDRNEASARALAARTGARMDYGDDDHDAMRDRMREVGTDRPGRWGR